MVKCGLWGQTELHLNCNSTSFVSLVGLDQVWASFCTAGKWEQQRRLPLGYWNDGNYDGNYYYTLNQFGKISLNQASGWMLWETMGCVVTLPSFFKLTLRCLPHN